MLNDLMMVELLDSIKRGEAIDLTLLLRELRSKRVVIYGAGKTSQKLLELFGHYGILVDFFWDRGAEHIGKVNQISVLLPDFRIFGDEEKKDTLVIANAGLERTVNSIVLDLKSSGFPNIINGRKLIDILSYTCCISKIEKSDFSQDLRDCSRCTGFFEDCKAFRHMAKRHLDKRAVNGLCSIEIGSISIETTTKCTLKCKNCLQMIGKYTMHTDKDASLIISDMKKILGTAEFIYVLNLVGGELFLHRELKELMQKLLELDNIGILSIATNGTVVPDDEIFKLLSNRRTIVNISGYGDNTPEKLRANIDKFISKLKEYNVYFNYNTSMVWFEFEDFECKKRPIAELESIFAKCDFKCRPLLDGKLYHCDRDAHGTALSLLRDDGGSYCDIRNTDEKHLRERLIEFLDKQHIDACDYCTVSSEGIEAGVQLEKR
ncbi:MAG TPA: radical SAM protein [Candidatus Nitrosocosmicus sp.]|nr:radical SAM protein [Candidatus Nitrosocosmicus sp.]